MVVFEQTLSEPCSPSEPWARKFTTTTRPVWADPATNALDAPWVEYRAPIRLLAPQVSRGVIFQGWAREPNPSIKSIYYLITVVLLVTSKKA